MTLVILWSNDLHAFKKYTGMIYATIVEENGHVYAADSGLTGKGEFKDKQIIYFYQERGQKIALVNNKVLVDNSKEHKYHLVVNVLERKGETFKASVKFYRNSIRANQKSHSIISEVIKNEQVIGQLNARNSYKFIDNGKPNLMIAFDIDRVFPKKEILTKLQKQLNINSRIRG